MDIEIFNNLAGAINYKFPGKYDFFEVHQTHAGIFLAVWNDKEMGQAAPDESTMLAWVDEYEAVLPSLIDQARMAQLEAELVDARARKLAAIELTTEGKLDNATKWTESEAKIIEKMGAE